MCIILRKKIVVKKDVLKNSLDENKEKTYNFTFYYAMRDIRNVLFYIKYFKYSSLARIFLVHVII